MFRRLAALSPWKRRVLALCAGLALGAGITVAYLNHQYVGMRAFAADYVAAHKSGDVEKVAALFCWDCVTDADRARLKLVLKQELDLSVRSVRLDRPGGDEGAPRETLEGRRVPNLKPVCRLTVTFADAQGAGVSSWLVGKSDAGYRIVVYRPDEAR